MCDHAARTDHSIIADRDPLIDMHASADPNIITDRHCLSPTASQLALSFIDCMISCINTHPGTK